MEFKSRPYCAGTWPAICLMWGTISARSGSHDGPPRTAIERRDGDGVPADPKWLSGFVFTSLKSAGTLSPHSIRMHTRHRHGYITLLIAVAQSLLPCSPIHKVSTYTTITSWKVGTFSCVTVSSILPDILVFEQERKGFTQRIIRDSLSTTREFHIPLSFITHYHDFQYCTVLNKWV
ncbi:hypothetical protein EDB82DRAFT_316876 [Fusarium venenatum]|uniref:uncharacterized protein n=1 Tax=Fusarium venenatum TaxID=56646 RepID=UPI001D1E3B1D|nr:hypothetical protein EDB82DRAFT_316876 [Fusarium venenatum]